MNRRFDILSQNYLIAIGFAILLVGSLQTAAAAAAAADAPDYARDIAPLFTKYCAGCHNDTDREGELSLQSYASLLKGGANGSILTPGQGEASRLIRILSGTAEPKMPPEDEEQPTPAEIALWKAWIDAGAKGPRGTVTDPAAMLVTPRVKLLAPAKPVVNAVALAPAGNVVALARYGEVELQSLPGRKTLHKLTGHRGSVNAVAFSQDGQFVVAAAGEPGLVGEARLWNVADGSLVHTFRGHQDNLYAVRLSPDGKILATASYDSQIKLWNTADGKELRTLAGHNGAVFELAFRPDGRVLASASGDRTVKLWDVATGERLDTLKESLQELYALAFSPDGTRLAAAGVDNRIRVWQITPAAKEGSNRLLLSKFAHELPVLRLAYSADGRTLASAGEDRLIKIWDAAAMTIRTTLEPQSDWATGLALAADGRTLFVGRSDGTAGSYPLAPAAARGDEPLVALAETPEPADYGPQPAFDKLPLVEEAEPNDAASQAVAISAPGRAVGKIQAVGSQERDADLFRFDAKKGDQWIVETNAARTGSPLDTKLEILNKDANPVPRLLLRAVRDTAIEFRGMNSEQRGVRLANWEEMLLNEYIYLSGEVIKHYQQRRGPDADAQFYPENGSRFAFFDTTSRAHALGEPGYVVVPYAVGTELPNNGLPVFTLNYENDDHAQRKLGKDSQVAFTAPADGTYLIRVSDVRGFSGPDFKYEVILRRPQPGFQVTLAGANPTVGVGSGKAFTAKAERIDHFMGPIEVEISGLPPGWQVSSPIVIAAGLYEAQCVLNCLPGATEPTKEQLAAIKVTATATVCGQPRTQDAGSLGTIKLGPKPKVIAHLLPSKHMPPVPPQENGFPIMPEVTIAPGGEITCHLRVDRNGFDDRIAFDVANLPHGVIVDDIGLSGVLVREKETERSIFLRAEPWVADQDRIFFATAQVDGNQVSLPMLIHIRRPSAVAIK